MDKRRIYIDDMAVTLLLRNIHNAIDHDEITNGPESWVYSVDNIKRLFTHEFYKIYNFYPVSLDINSKIELLTTSVSPSDIGLLYVFYNASTSTRHELIRPNIKMIYQYATFTDVASLMHKKVHTYKKKRMSRIADKKISFEFTIDDRPYHIILPATDAIILHNKNGLNEL